MPDPVDPTIQKIHISALHLDPDNARAHPQVNLDTIQRSVEQVGLARSIVIDEDHNVIAGNGTTEVVGQMGIEEVWVIKAPGNVMVAVQRDDWTAEQKRLAALFDNHGSDTSHFDADWLTKAASTIPDLLTTVFGAPTVAGWLPKPAAAKADPGPRTDEASALQAQWQTALGQKWVIPSLGRPDLAHILVVGDSTHSAAWDSAMAGHHAVMMFTDPPYGVQYEGHKTIRSRLHNDTADQMPPMLDAAFTEATHCLLSGAPVYICSPDGEQILTFGQAFRAAGWHYHQALVWVKDSFVIGHNDYHFRHETIHYGWTPGAAHVFYGGRALDSVWEVKRPYRSAEHPTSKPVELYERALHSSSLPGALVVDPFAGGGPMLVACERLGRAARLIEIDPAYAAVILQRAADIGLTPWREHGEAG